MREAPVILYMSGTVPKRSETFVYREIFALRELGVDVRTASVHEPTRGLDDNGPLSRMAEDTIEIYSKGVVQLLADYFAELVSHPVRTIRTIIRAKIDAFLSRDIPTPRRLKVIWQAMAGVALARRVRLMNVAHIHCHMAHVPATIGMYAASQLGITFSFTGHANDLFPNRTLLTEKLSRALWVNCISEWHRDFYKSIVDRPDHDYPIVRCGVDTRRYPVTPAPRADRLEVLGVGRLVEKKGFDVLIQAAGDLARAGGAKVRVRIAGGGEQEPSLRELVRQLPALAEVELLGDTDNDAVMDLVGQVDVFALPCRVARSGDRDGIPVVLMEAMARGRCVISGDLETIRELVRDGQTGVMIPPGDRQALVSALRDLARDRDRVDELGKAARARVEEEFDLMRNAERIVIAMRTHGVLPPEVVS
ncbi:MAG: colanic acid biosynthesis glycosyltransferase WcaL [Planctomycetota bacterium]|nr:MAG: colanic acid biosynthesis glycosyltransferase WcaL [Planctomycetota bacterium]